MRDKNFKVNILRNSTLFGFSQNLRLDLVINIFVYSYWKNKKITVHGDGNQWRPFISLNDVAKVYKIIVNENYPSFIVNLVSFNATIKDIAFKIIEHFNGKYQQINFLTNNSDNRNYKTKSVNMKKYFGELNFSDFNFEIKQLLKGIKKHKIKIDASTIRMKFYKKKFKKID